MQSEVEVNRRGIVLCNERSANNALLTKPRSKKRQGRWLEKVDFHLQQSQFGGVFVDAKWWSNHESGASNESFGMSSVEGNLVLRENLI